MHTLAFTCSAFLIHASVHENMHLSMHQKDILFLKISNLKLYHLSLQSTHVHFDWRFGYAGLVMVVMSLRAGKEHTGSLGILQDAQRVLVQFPEK